MSLLVDRASILREFFRLVNADAADEDMIEHDAATLEGAYEALDVGLRRAQLYMIANGAGGLWLKTSPTLVFSGTDPDRYALLPSDFLRLDSDPDQNRSGLRSPSGIPWGKEIVPADRNRAWGRYFYLRLRPDPRELVTNGTFDGGSTGWVVGAGWTVANGVATSSGSSADLEETLSDLVAGEWYKLRCVLTGATTGSLEVYLGGDLVLTLTTNATHLNEVIAGASGSLLEFRPSGGWDGTLDEVSVRAEGWAVWVARSSAAPSNLVADYFNSIGALNDGAVVDFPQDDRHLIPAYAAAHASSQSWFPGGQEEKAAIEKNLLRVQQESYRRNRPSRMARRVSTARATGRWIVN